MSEISRSVQIIKQAKKKLLTVQSVRMLTWQGHTMTWQGHTMARVSGRQLAVGRSITS
jgi:hypothetical protein